MMLNIAQVCAPVKQFYKQFSCQMAKKDEQDFLDQTSSFDSPEKKSKILSCPDTTISEYDSQYLEAKLHLFRQSQERTFALQLSKIQKTTKNFCAGLAAIIVLLLMSLFFLYSQQQKQVQQLNSRVNELQFKQTQIISDLLDLQRVGNDQNQQILALESSNEKIKEEIIDLHMNQLLKEERSMHVFQKYTNFFKFQIDPKIDYLQQNFKIQKQSQGVQVRKRTDQELMFFSTHPIPQGGIYYLKVKIVETLYGMISIGVMPEHRRQQRCVYCDSNEIYYMYCKNGKIYTGQILNLIKQSKSSQFNKIKEGDVVTIFVDNKQRKLIWYVNSRYAGSQMLTQTVKEWYPFIEMTSRGDILKIIQ